jgi:hypothetical protein
MIHFLAPDDVSDLPLDYFTKTGLEDRTSVITFEDLLHRDTLPFGAYVFAGINRLGPHMARLLADVYDQLRDGTGITPLNHPVRSLRRYELIHALHERDMIPYTAYGAWEDFSAVRMPAFVRPREADGGVPDLKHSLRELEKEIGNSMVWGRTAEELIVVEFADTSVDGVFTKYAAHRIGDRIIARSIDRGTHWVQRRHHSEITMELIEESEEYEETNPFEDQVLEIFDLARIEFGRMDFSVLDGRVICWEINTLPLMRRPEGVSALPEDLQRARLPGRARFAERLADAYGTLLERVDGARASRPSAPDEVPIVHAPDLLAEARREVAARGVTTSAGRGQLALLRTILRPLKPILRPIAVATVYPLLARMARR